jgi:putative Ca2+/H+ antiporter (TMEM165/GDT1 family)
MTESLSEIISTTSYAFGAVFVSEICDKTFMLLVSLSKSNSSLLLVLLNQLAMTPLIVLSALIGDYMSFLPKFYVSLLGAVCFLIFSILCFRESFLEHKKNKEKDMEKKHQAKYKSLFEDQSWWKFSLVVVITIICMEITDSSEFALFSLALTYDASCVIAGAFIAHGCCAGLAVSIGKIIARYVSEWVTHLCVGCFFLWLAGVWVYYCFEDGVLYFE